MAPIRRTNPKTVATVLFQPMPDDGGLEIISDGEVPSIGAPTSSIGGKGVLFMTGGSGGAELLSILER